MWSALLPFGLQLVTFLLNRSAAQSETKRKYYEFLSAIDADASFSVNLRKSAMSQRERIEKMIDDEKAAEANKGQ